MEIVIAIGVTALIAFGAWRVLSGRYGLPPIDITPDRPLSFGYKTSWLAVPATDSAAVAKALALADPKFSSTTFHPCNWTSAFYRLHASFLNREVFVTPPIDGWVLVKNWAASEDNAEALRPVLEILSEQFGEAYWFASHRVVSYVGWGVARDGELVRLYSEADFETLFDVGKPTPAELERELLTAAEWSELLDQGVSPAEEDTLADKLADEATVVSLAGQWSLDPTTLDGREVAGLGRIGRPR